jgi:hypothetical protein
MAIEGPLRELGIHDVFQLLDLSRKTGALTVTSALRDNQGTVYFDRGTVVFAAIRSNPHPLGELLLRAGKITDGDLDQARELQRRNPDGRRLGEILVESGAITRKELERQVRFQVEEVVFELMSWREGFFSFEEREVTDAPMEANIRISTEALLMEGARRIDEWSRIEDKVPHLGVVPALAAAGEEHTGLLDLLPKEWEVLAEIDGAKDLRAIAAMLALSEFDVARIAYGLVSTGIIELQNGRTPVGSRSITPVDGVAPIDLARAALKSGNAEEALVSAQLALTVDPDSADVRLVLARALMRLGRHGEALDELRRAMSADALNPELHRDLGFCAAWRGDYLEAAGSWERYLKLAPSAPDAPRIRGAVESLTRLRSLLSEHLDG